ncbi:MAG: hypothetical protein V3W37_06150, partial [Candidatus Binatia bacterium]
QFPLPGPDSPMGGGPPSPLEFGEEIQGMMSSMSFLAARKPVASTLVKEIIKTAEIVRDLDPKLGSRMSHILMLARGEPEGIRISENG